MLKKKKTLDVCLAFAAIENELLEKCNITAKIARIEECRDIFFLEIYKGLLGDDFPGEKRLLKKSLGVFVY